MKFCTMNSIYEVDTENKRIRRLNGKDDPTPRQGPDGEWKPYLELMNDVKIGDPLIIAWTQDNNTGVVKTTMTSTIVSFEN